MNLSVTPFGLALAVNTSTASGLPHVVATIGARQQALQNSRWIYRCWADYDPPKQLKTFAMRLRKLSCLELAWQIGPGHDGARLSAIAFLSFDPRNPNLEFDDKKISKQNYLTELHRILLENNLPVCLVTGEQIYVGFTGLSERRCRRISMELRKRILRVANAENESEKVLVQLNRLTGAMGLRDVCGYYFAVDEHSIPETYYYIDVRYLPEKYSNDFYEALQRFVPDLPLSSENTAITFGHAHINQGELNGAIRQFQQQVTLVEQKVVEEWQPVPSRRQRKTPASDKGKTKVKAAAPTARTDFGNAVAFFKFPPDEQAYPLHAPWLPEGRACASLDPKVLGKVEGYLTEEDVLSRLDVGFVHGAHASAKSKAGVVGIQTTNEPYKSTDDKCYTSSLKLKFSNNVRIFGRQERQGTDDKGNHLVHYRFDGAGFGH
jgi:hypothetical protein